LSTSASWSGCRKSAFSSSVTLPSSATSTPVGRLGQRVDLDQRGVLGDEGLHSFTIDVGDLVGDLGRELAGGDDLAGLRLVDALDGVDRDLGDPPRGWSGDLSISMPPSTLAMQRKVRLARSSRKEK
jgi:hypothetical protein